MPFASNQGINIYFEVHGEAQGNSARDKPVLVFAHGAGGNAASWWQQVPAFVSSHKVIVFDHRGFGRTVCAADAVDAGCFEEDLRAVLDAAAVDTACIVCQSMGGWTGVRAAVSFPERIRGVLLANTPGAVMCDEAATLLNCPRAWPLLAALWTVPSASSLSSGRLKTPSCINRSLHSTADCDRTSAIPKSI